MILKERVRTADIRKAHLGWTLLFGYANLPKIEERLVITLVDHLQF